MAMMLMSPTMGRADVVSVLLPWSNPIPGDPQVRAVDINSSGWVLGGTRLNYEPFVLVWIPNGLPTIDPSFHIFSSLTIGGTHPVDLNDSGDVLIQFLNDTVDKGKDYQIFHTSTSTYSPAFTSDDVPTNWGPISTQSDNGNGMRFENFGPDTGDYPESGAELITTAAVPEPASLALFGAVLAALAPLIGRRVRRSGSASA